VSSLHHLSDWLQKPFQHPLTRKSDLGLLQKIRDRELNLVPYGQLGGLFVEVALIAFAEPNWQFGLLNYASGLDSVGAGEVVDFAC
ncbi:17731_t:CDS:2, partial [Cetraspora pellucida]